MVFFCLQKNWNWFTYYEGWDLELVLMHFYWATEEMLYWGAVASHTQALKPTSTEVSKMVPKKPLELGCSTIFQGGTVSFAACNEKRLNVELLFPSTVTFITWMIIWIWQLTSLRKKTDYHHEWVRIKCKTPILQWTSVVPSELQATLWYWTQKSISQVQEH